MRRYAFFTTMLVVILLAMLAGSWIWFLGFEEPGERPELTLGGSPSSDSLGHANRSHNDTDASTSRPDDSDAPGALERREQRGPEFRSHHRTEPSRSVESREGLSSDEKEEEAEEEIVVQRDDTKPGVVDSNGKDDGLDSLVVSTLEAPAKRRQATEWHGEFRFSDESLGLIPRSKLRGIVRVIPPPEVTHLLRGKLIFPELDEIQQKELREDHRFQVTMYTPEIPLMREIVGEEGEFVMPMTDAMVRNYERRGQRVYVHSPAFRLKSGKGYVDFRKERTEFEIELELTPPLQVIVNVSPEYALQDEVLVWLERRGDPHGGAFDDSLYMRARVRPTEHLRFFVPARYGELRVAAIGARWHSGDPRTWDVSRVRGDTLRVKLNVFAATCDLIRGRVDSADSNPVEAVRLACTHFDVVTYTDGRGEFEAHVPFENTKIHRQFIATRAGMRPEVLPLEMHAKASPGVSGSKPNGPFEVTMSGKVEVELRLPDDAEEDEMVTASGQRIPWGETRQGSRIRKVELVWGSRLLFVFDRRKNPALIIDEDAWAKAYQQYADGTETPVIHVKRLGDVLD